MQCPHCQRHLSNDWLSGFAPLILLALPIAIKLEQTLLTLDALPPWLCFALPFFICVWGIPRLCSPLLLFMEVTVEDKPPPKTGPQR